MDSESRYGTGTVGQVSVDAALSTFTRQTKPQGNLGIEGRCWLFGFGFRSHAHADSYPDRRQAAGEARPAR
ncbi:hypothetical protein [Halobaculum sp. D14]|uniref:hypothetical protein n=1 Tax=unclassified Halobaculum TaxID=2640896 RepID=UPI003EB99A78